MGRHQLPLQAPIDLVHLVPWRLDHRGSPPRTGPQRVSCWKSNIHINRCVTIRSSVATRQSECVRFVSGRDSEVDIGLRILARQPGALTMFAIDQCRGDDPRGTGIALSRRVRTLERSNRASAMADISRHTRAGSGRPASGHEAPGRGPESMRLGLQTPSRIDYCGRRSPLAGWQGRRPATLTDVGFRG
jgi:hypothetical protein